MNSTKERFKEILENVNHGLENVVTDNFPQNLYKPMQYVLSSEGKRLRPLLLINACKAVGGKDETAYNAGLAIEILHNFTLVHDDIMDEDDLRRGRETVHKKWNESIAILAGDGLIALAYRCLLLTDSDNIKQLTHLFSEAIIKVCEGQSLDKELEDVTEASVEEYVDMIGRKTAELLAVSTAMGGVIGNASDKQLKALRKYGMELGLAFQIQDDLLDIYSEEEVLGKDLGSDLALGKKTYPILVFKNKASSEDLKIFNDELADINNIDLDKVKFILNKYNVYQDTVDKVNRMIDRSIEYLNADGLNLYAEDLVYIAEKIRSRKS